VSLIIIDAAVALAGMTPASPVLLAALPAWLLYAVAAAVLVSMLGGVILFLYRQGTTHVHRHSDDWPLPPLIVPPGLSDGSTPRERGWHHAAGPLSNGTHDPDPALSPPVRPAEPLPRPVAKDAEETAPVAAGHVRFHRPPEGTLQLLPGRLEILSGSERIEEIRFVRIPGRDAVVTFGRTEGEPHTHVQLESPTVSRMHAVMRFQLGRWHIANLSQTNPVLVGGNELPTNGDDAVPLQDGDEVEMGEVMFRFRLR
jgi:hypothetical protein